MSVAKIAVRLLAVSWMLAIGLVVVTAAPVSGEKSGEQEDTTMEAARGRERWHTPCAGNTLVDNYPAIPDKKRKGKKQQKKLIIQDVQIQQLFEYAEEVNRSVRVFKDNYKDTRFNDATVRDNLEKFGDNILGYTGAILEEHPDLKKMQQVVPWVQVSVNKFSWVAAYMGLGREEESLHERDYFRHRFERTEEQAYWILCTLHRILHNLGAPANNPLTHEDAIPEIYKLEHDTVRRHQRNYLALRDCSRYLDQFIKEIRSACLVGGGRCNFNPNLTPQSQLTRRVKEAR